MLTRLEERYIAARRAGKILNPCPGHPITTPWGIRGSMWGSGHHTGEDHACPLGTPVVAVTWGHVIGAGWSALGWGNAYGNIVIVRTATGKYDYGFCHLSEIHVRVGQAVMPGMVMGHAGSTGNSTGPHLHFEARPHGGLYGSDINPINVKQEGH